MTDIVVENLNPLLVEKLKLRSERHQRSLNEELIVILEQAVDSELDEQTVAEARAKLEQARARYSNHLFSDSTELIREDRAR